MKRNDFYRISSNVDDLIKEGKIDQAISNIELELQNDPNNPVFYSILGELYEARDNDKSIFYYEKGLEKFTDNPYLLIGLGFIYYNMNVFEKAQYYFQQAWLNDPTNIKLVTAIGNILRNLKDYEKGLKYYELAIKLEPENIFALFGLADCYRGLNRHDKSLEVWIQLSKIDPQNKIFLTRIGDSFRLLKENDTALNYYKKALDIDYDFFAMLGCALIYESIGSLDKALETFKELEDKEFSNSRFFYEYLKFLIRNQQYQTAQKVFSMCEKKFKNNKFINSLKEKIYQ